MKIGIIREGKNPPDKRTPFPPGQLKSLNERFGDQLTFIVESSPSRCYSDDEYRTSGIEVADDISDADVFFGVKEVPIEKLNPDKTYFFFSHTIKKQRYNKNLLRAILEKNIRLIDYEVLKDDQGNRVVAFGRWAGIVGAYNAFWAYGKKTALYDIKRASECMDLSELKLELKKVQLPPIKIVVTGSGRVGKGVKEILEVLNIPEVETHEFLHLYFEEPVFTVLSSSDYNRRKADGAFDREEFYSSPELYESHFLKFAEAGEMLIAAAYWDPDAPRLFKLEDINSPDFALSVIADVTCDIGGSIPTTLRASTILEPIYDVDRASGTEIPAFGSQTSISVMAIDNLPCELPRESSLEFGKQLEQWVVPALLEENSPILERATVARDGDLTLEFMYLRDFVDNIE
ncbi:MAG: NAD(P)-dependent oxidoreductase [Algoriphagus sp.]|jgi:alanine dehydrogenase|uniref:NAD(P)-dependent oxidoreductase n=1 Tax=Algoriphagus sp. TaxID=1872435 RepID=UPI002716C32B|nr:NAD(P)-dependent oxidoreductase [Algoriphagus sp.]MDO8967709.1 NAD(P)-dependent oxidoreductase [Algoriphagus sp.]MDP2041922.1 NAD(P)-dependent oxidoreductase [Algoriphagus sp.]MDP3199993.1 NAD(P)-dependent oxidoreductase [Algoriphagus sp.]MDP3472653.1 NAD(P)-dependent oxidoreductase [Algoriphagus sp.]